MSMFMELFTELPSDEVVRHLSSGRVGSVKVGPVERDERGPFGRWDYGVFSVKALTDEDHEELNGYHGLPSTLRTRIWFSTQPYYEGQLALYGLMAHLLRTWPGDLALVNYGETVNVERVNGHIRLRVEYLNEDILPIFESFDYQPLPVPPVPQT